MYERAGGLMGGLADLPNVGKVLERSLLEVDIRTPDQLRRVGSHEAFLRIRTTVDPGACLHMLEGIEGAIRGVPDTELPQDVRDALRAFYRSLD
jgi:DNA transformation protein and related proteins